VIVDIRMNVIRATSGTLKKLLSTKSGTDFVSSYHAKMPNGTLIKLLHPFKHEAKKKVWFLSCVIIMIIISLSHPVAYELRGELYVFNSAVDFIL